MSDYAFTGLRENSHRHGVSQKTPYKSLAEPAQLRKLGEGYFFPGSECLGNAEVVYSV